MISTSTTAVPTTEPLEANLGDTLQWTKDLGSEFSGWTLTYYLRGPQNQVIVCTYASGLFTALAAAGTTAQWSSGDYILTGIATSGTSRVTVYSNKLKLNPDTTSLPDGFDSRSHAKKVLDAVEDVIERRATRPESQYQLEGIGRQFIYKTDKELTDLRALYQSEYQRELDGDAIARGETPNKNIGIRFNRVW